MTDEVEALHYSVIYIDTKEQKGKYRMGVVDPVVYPVTYLYKIISLTDIWAFFLRKNEDPVSGQQSKLTRKYNT